MRARATWNGLRASGVIRAMRRSRRISRWDMRRCCPLSNECHSKPRRSPCVTSEGSARVGAFCGNGNCEVLASPMARRYTVFAFLLVLLFQSGAFAQTPVAYRLSFPEAVHHLMQV